ncbi:MAG: exonuclease SbcCD subunit D [Lachnospiraceae bacterium]|nr:exonuclease SbcCD subunit D [Lachnospiraceae bacterium]
MRFLHIADLHLGKQLMGYSLLEDQAYILKEILEIAGKEEAEGILIAGDIYDKAVPPAEAVALLDTFLTQLTKENRKVFLISGNHDNAQRVSFGRSVMQKAEVYISPVFSGLPEKIVMEDRWGKLNVFLMPYIRPAMVRAAYDREDVHSYEDAFRLVLEHMKTEGQLLPGERNVLLAHQFLTGAEPSESEEFTVGGLENISAALLEDFDYVALGHIHRAQKVGRESVRYSGTPLKYSFSEVNHKKSVTIVEVEEKGNVRVQTRDLIPLRDLVQLKGTYDELTAADFYKDRNREDYYRIILTDEEEVFQAVAKLRLIYPNLMRVEYENLRSMESRVLESSEELQKKEPMDFLEELFLLQNNQDMTEDQVAYARKVLEEVL